VSNGGAVRLERTFQADIDRVFRAFTDLGELVHWWGLMDVRTFPWHRSTSALAVNVVG
jgi:uncharacterized protein YndB with AHSA1/START domain